MNWSYALEKNAENYPDKVAVVFGNRRFTYAELERRVNSLAAGLKELGVKVHDRVAILLYNCSEYIEIGFATNKLGAAWLPMNYRLAGEELAYILNNAEASILISEKDFIPTIESVRKSLNYTRTFLTISPEPPRDWLNYDELLDKNMGKIVPHAMVEIDDLHRLVYTSGTTAHPKGVMLTYGNLYWKNFGHMIMFNLTPKDVTLMVGPLYHVGGMDAPGTAVIYLGGTVVILRQFDPFITLETIQREKITTLWLAPAMINMVVSTPGYEKYDVKSVRILIDGGEKMPLPLIEKVKKWIPDVWFADGYGLTETVSGDTFLDKTKTIEKIGSVGKPVAGLRVKIVDDQMREMKRGEVGEIALRGPKVFKGYWKNPEATAEVLKNGWFLTGDIGYLDEDGYLYLVDRKKDMIISGGENIASLEVERVIYEVSKVLEVAVVGIPDHRWGEVPVAFVVLKSGENMTEGELIDFCRSKLAKFKVPKEVIFIGQLPRNPSGKVLKRELRKHKSKTA